MIEKLQSLLKLFHIYFMLYLHEYGSKVTPVKFENCYIVVFFKRCLRYFKLKLTQTIFCFIKHPTCSNWDLFFFITNVVIALPNLC